MGINILIVDIIFIVVIPDIRVSLRDQGLLNTVLPELISFRIGEIQITCIASPERELCRCPVLIVQEPSVSGYLIIQRMVIKECRFYIGDYLQPFAAEIVGQSLRIRDLVCVPVEDIALVSDLSVTAGHIESAGTYAVLLTVVDKGAQARVRVIRIRIFHGGTAVPEGPFGDPADAACHMYESFYYLIDISQDDVEDHVLFFISHGTEMFVVVVMFPPKIHLAVAVGVIEDAVASVSGLADVERQVFIQRVAVFRSESHGVIGIELVPVMVLVNSAGLVPQSVDILVFLSPDAMNRTFSQFPVEVVRQSAAVLIQDALLTAHCDAEIEELYFEIVVCVPEAHRFFILSHLRRAQSEAVQRQLVSSSAPDPVLIRIDAEGRENVLVLYESHTEHILYEIDTHKYIPAPVQAGTVICVLQYELMSELHTLALPLLAYF